MFRRFLLSLCLCLLPAVVKAQTEPPPPRPKLKPAEPKKEKPESQPAQEPAAPNTEPANSGFALPVFRMNAEPIYDPALDNLPPPTPRCETYSAQDYQWADGRPFPVGVNLKRCEIWDGTTYTEWSITSSGMSLPDGRNSSLKKPGLILRLPRDAWAARPPVLRTRTHNGFSDFLLGNVAPRPYFSNLNADVANSIRQIIVKLDEPASQTFTVTVENLNEKSHQRIWNAGAAFLYSVSQPQPAVAETGLNAIIELWKELSAAAVEREWEATRQKNLQSWLTVTQDFRAALEKIPAEQFGQTLTPYGIATTRDNQPVYYEKEKTTLSRELNFALEELSRNLAHSRYSSLRARPFLYSVVKPPIAKEECLAVIENLREVGRDKFMAVGPTTPRALGWLDEWQYLTKQFQKAQEEFANLTRLMAHSPSAEFLQAAPVLAERRTKPQEKYATIDSWEMWMEEIIAGVSLLSEAQLRAVAALIVPPTAKPDEPRSVGEYLLYATLGTRMTMTPLGCDLRQEPRIDSKTPLTKEVIVNALKALQRAGRNSLCSCQETYISNPPYTGITPFMAFQVFTLPALRGIQANLNNYLNKVGIKPITPLARSPSTPGTCPLIGEE